MSSALRIAAVLLLSLCHLPSRSQGIPHFLNITPEEYKAHKQNFDIVTGSDGTVYIANFEGLLYYDNAQWRIIYTPGITRVTSLFRDSRGTLWAGGYNFIGRLETDGRGILRLRNLGKGATVSGEVLHIWESGGQVCINVSDGNVYALSDSTATPAPHTQQPADTLPLPASWANAHQHYIVNDVEDTGDFYAVATSGDGVVLIHKDGREMCRITESNGLCSDNVSALAYNGRGLLWGTTDNGIFAVAIPSAYSHFTANEGLTGEVLSMARLGHTVYAGTSGGLFCLEDKRFEPVEGISLACWQLLEHDGRLLAATAGGLYSISPDRKVSALTTENTLSMLSRGDSLYTGEMDGVYINRHDGQRQKVWNIEKVVRMACDDNDTIWLQSIYGKVWYMQPGSQAEPVSLDTVSDKIRTLVSYQGRVMPISADDDSLFPFALFSYADSKGLLWLTDNKGKRLYAMKDGKRDMKASQLAYPLMDYPVRTMLRIGEQIWMGGVKGINIMDSSREEPATTTTPRLHIRSVIMNGDSVLWGGYGTMPGKLPRLGSNDRHVTFHYATDLPSLLLNTQYRTRINGGNWSAWETATEEEYSNLSYGDYVFEVQARDAYGQLSDIVAMEFTITPPFHLRWFMLIFYAILLAALVYALLQLRLYRLEKDKQRLEAVVQERTADLMKAQHELVRQEKMATVGKLTKGLIDRILNPLNYINNFSKLSLSLVNDAMANIEDEKENISPDTYADTVEVLDMLHGNLQKVNEHGANTSRVLKAMEEMLKDRSGGQAEMSLTDMMRQDRELLKTHFGKEISENNIATVFTLTDDEVLIKGNPQLLSMTIMSLLRNAVYAVVKKRKALQEQAGGNSDYSPEVRLDLSVADGKAHIAVRDNGTGIEATVIDRIFDPFFTTKTTAEASGVGLYISREVVQNHGGDITVKSEKDSYTEFTITLPVIKRGESLNNN